MWDRNLMPCPEFLVLGDLVKQVRTPPVRPADGVVRCVYESFVPGEDYCGLGLRAKIKSAEHAPAL